jgi:hypothetical protein
MVRKKFADYNTSDITVKAKVALTNWRKDTTATAFYAEMRRFLPSARRSDVADELAAHNARQRRSIGKRCVRPPQLATPHWPSRGLRGINGKTDQSDQQAI